MSAVDGLIIDEPYVSDILRGTKTWEMRSRTTHKRGRIALIRKGSGQIVGYADLIDVLQPLTSSNYSDFFEKHRVPEAVWKRGGFKWFTPWVLGNIEKLVNPIPYQHKSGAVTWVRLNVGQDEVDLVPATSDTLKIDVAINDSLSSPMDISAWRALVALSMAIFCAISAIVVVISVPLAVIGGIFNAKVFFTFLVGGGLCGGLAGLFDPSLEFQPSR